MDNQYFGRVRALSANCTSDWVISKRLNPRADTYLILPKLNYTSRVSSITILVPTPYIPILGKDKRPVTVEELYKNDTFEYHLNFFNPEKQDTWQKTQKDGLFEVTGLSPDVEYDGNVYITIDNERRSNAHFFVVRTLPDYSLVILITSLVAVFVIALSAGLLLLSCKYVKQTVQTPISLVFQKSPTLPLLTLPKDKVIDSFTVGFRPAIFMQHYEQKHLEKSRNIWQEIPGNTQLQTYASQSHDASTPEQEYCPQKNASTSLSSVQYGKVFDMTPSNVTYVPTTTPNACSQVSYDVQGEFQKSTCQPFVDYDKDASNAFLDDPFKSNLFSFLLGEESNIVLNSLSPMGLISSVTVRDYGCFPAQMEQTEEHSPEIHLGFTSDQITEHNLQHSYLENGGISYILQSPVENPMTDTLERTTAYKQQCIL
ncbi:interleukin-22 receptor subunit alpha-1 isoform X2 [Dendropsophus ebraccatus]